MEDSAILTENRFGFLATLGFSDWEPERVVNALSELGYTSVEWSLSHLHPHRKSQEELNRAVRVSEQAGLIVSEVVVQQDLISLDPELVKQRVKLTRDCLQASSEAGVGIINIFSGPAPWDPTAPKLGVEMSEGKAWDILLPSMEELVRVAESENVVMALEAVFGMLCRDYYSSQELFRQIDSPYLAMNFDPSHMVLYRNDIPWAIHQCADKIKHFHLKDAIGVPGVPDRDFMFPLLGEGMVDWHGALTALREIGYTGCLSVEFEAYSYYTQVLDSDPVEAARLSMQQIRKLNRARPAEQVGHATDRVRE